MNVGVFQFTCESKQVSVSLPLSDNNLDLLIKLIMGMRNSHEHVQGNFDRNVVESSQEYDTHLNDLVEDFYNNHGNGNVKNNVKPDVDTQCKQVVNESDTIHKRIAERMLPDEDVLVKKSDSRNISVYRPVVNYLLDNLKDKFTAKDIAHLIFKCYNFELNRKIAQSTAHVYSCDYRQYLVDQGLVQIVDNNLYKRIDNKKKQS